MTNRTRARNSPCACGSGEKFKDCCRDKKPREQYLFSQSKTNIGALFPDGVIRAGTKIEMRISAAGPQVRIGDKQLAMGPLYLVNSYARGGKREKILRQVPRATFDLKDLLNPEAIHCTYSSYDLIFVIDTNTRSIQGRLRSASYSLLCKTQVHQDEGEFHYRHYAAFQYQDLSPPDAEKQALVDLLRSILRNPGYRPTHRIALVTDHDLKSHVGINNGEIPLRDGSKLPQNFSLIYASADGGSENPLNKAMALCDKTAAAILGRQKHCERP